MSGEVLDLNKEKYASLGNVQVAFFEWSQHPPTLHWTLQHSVAQSSRKIHKPPPLLPRSSWNQFTINVINTRLRNYGGLENAWPQHAGYVYTTGV